MTYSPSTQTGRQAKLGNLARVCVLSIVPFDVKFEIFSGRDKLRQIGIRVSTDHTSWDKADPQDFTQNGQSGSFFIFMFIPGGTGNDMVVVNA